MELRNKTYTLFAIVLISTMVGCGVKGRPVAPKNPAPLGRGEPTYKEKQKKKPVSSTTSSSAPTEEAD